MSKKNRFSHQGSAVAQSLSFFTAYWFEIPVQFDLGHILVKNQLLKIARNSKEKCLFTWFNNLSRRFSSPRGSQPSLIVSLIKEKVGSNRGKKIKLKFSTSKLHPQAIGSIAQGAFGSGDTMVPNKLHHIHKFESTRLYQQRLA